MNCQIIRATLTAGCTLLIPCIFSVTSFAGMMSNDSYTITDDVLSGGGGTMSSANYTLQATFGQPSPIGVSSSSAYSNHAGFWYFLITLGDVNGDGFVDLTDVIRVLQVLSGQNGGQIYKAADIDGDGKVGLEELLYGLGKLVE